MDELEKRLKSIPLREPSGKLEAAVLSQRPESGEMFPLGFIPVRWAMGIALFMGILGFCLGTYRRSEPTVSKTPAANTTYVYLIPDSDSSKRWFDLTPSNPSPPIHRWKIITNDIKGEHHEPSL